MSPDHDAPPTIEVKMLLDFTDDVAAQRLFDEAFTHPDRRYSITPVNTSIASTWLRTHAARRHFGWAAEERRQPMCLHDVISLDELYYRNSCGYAQPITSEDEAAQERAETGYLCYCPDVKTPWGSDTERDEVAQRRLCLPWQCPVASEAYASDLLEHAPDLWQSDYADRTDDDGPCGEWMILFARPRDAFVPTLQVLGCEDSRR